MHLQKRSAFGEEDMLKRYLEFVGTTRILWISFILMNATTFGIFRNLPDLDALVIDRMMSYGAEDVVAALTAIGEHGRRTYLWANAIDMVFPLFYGSFFAGVLYRFRLREALWILSLMPLFAGLADIGENIQIRTMLQAFPNISDAQASASSVFTQAKWWLIVTSMAGALVAGLAAIVRHFRRKD
jgi:hypothetical protein